MTDPLSIWLGALARQGLRDQGWNQARLAREVGITAKHLNNVLLGHRPGSIQVWDRLLRAVGKHPEGW